MKLIIPILLFAWFCSTPDSSSQILEPVTWNFEIEEIGENQAKVVFTASIDETWYLYSTDVPEGGPIPTTFHFEDSENFELIGDITPESSPERKYDPTFDMELDLHSNEAVFTQKIRLLSGEAFNIEGYVEFMSCDDTRCTPPQQQDFSLLSEGIKETAEEPEAEEEIAATEEKESVEETVQAPEPEEEEAPEETEDIPGVEEPSQVQAEERRDSIWTIFFVAFLGGLAGLLTPCVFPLIPLTVSYFMQNQSGKLNSILNATVFGLSIIVIFTGIGGLVSLTGGAGFTAAITSHWLPNTIFFILFLLFAASFFGMFEISLPASLASKTDKKADKGGYVGSFFMALTLVIVSLSCVGPIVGAILVRAAAGGGLEPVAGMLGFSLAFSMPFTLLAIFPSYLNKLPKSGGWLNSVKVVLGFIVLAFSLTFLSVIDQSYHLGLLGREIFIAFWIVLFFLLGLYLLGKIRFAHDSEVSHVSVPRLFLAIAVFTFVVYLIPGMFGAPLKSVSSLLPPEHTHSFNLRTMAGTTVTTDESGTALAENCEEPRYDDFLHKPHGLEGYFDLEQALDCAERMDRPVFVYFTGHACSNCKEMESKVWSDPEVLQKLQEEYILVSLYVDERNRVPESEWYTSEVDNREKRTIGQQNLDYQISRFNTNTQPFNIVLDHNQEPLTEPYGYNLDVQAFLDYLDKGIEAYSQKGDR